MNILKRRKSLWAAAFIFSFGVGLGLFFVSNGSHSGLVSSEFASRGISSEQDLYSSTVQKVFNARCIACHSCLDAPCQLNLQSYEGLSRGLTNKDAYDPSRSRAVTPTRIFEDAQSTLEWHQKMGFHDVIGNHLQSVLLNALTVAKRNRPTIPVKESRTCNSQDNSPKANEQNAVLAMPYGMAEINYDDTALIYKWISAGAPPPPPANLVDFSLQIRPEVQSWNQFFNQPDLKSKLLSRYLYEHLFLAHFYFQQSPREFLKIIRSSTSCDNPKIISTRQANDFPADIFNYCLVKDSSTIVVKTHMPYKLSPEKMAWIKNNFSKTDWTVSELPKYNDEVASNPFETFKDIPVEARYRFLLEDAQYHVMTFVKGPVCSGSTAVNSIQEQFYVFFMNPSSDLMVRSHDYAESVRKNVDLPGEFGSDVAIGKAPNDWKRYTDRRQIYETLARQEIKRLSPNGLSLSDIWNGDDVNDNAVLTVFRHDDNAAVLKGPRGDLPKTYFVLDYSTFERICYNLVVNFDVFGTLSHQVLTRFYMDILRMDAENNFLYFLPQNERKKIKNSWYTGTKLNALLTDFQLKYLNEYAFPDVSTQVTLPGKEDAAKELARKIVSERFSAQVRGPDDVINWKMLKHTDFSQDPIEGPLKAIGGVHGAEKPFAQYFPELTYLVIPAQGTEPARVYSLVHNVEHTNVAWVLTGKRVPKEDSITVGRGIYGSYPNLFITTEAGNVAKMVKQLYEIDSAKDYAEFLKKYGVDRMESRLWGLYDTIYLDGLRTNPVEAGYLDLSRYQF